MSQDVRITRPRNFARGLLLATLLIAPINAAIYFFLVLGARGRAEREGRLGLFLLLALVQIITGLAGFIAALSIPFAIVGCLAPTLEISILAFFIYSIIVHSYLGPTFSTFLSLSPARLRGAMSALLLVGMNLVGFGIGPQLTGIISDVFNARGIEEPLRYAMLLMTFFLLLSAIFYFIASTTTNKDAESDEAE